MQNLVHAFVLVIASLVTSVSIAAEPAPADQVVDETPDQTSDQTSDQPPDQAPDQAAKVAARKARGGKAAPGKAPVPGGPMDQDALWWNDPAIQKALSLSENQKAMMSAYLGAYRENVPPDWKLETFHEALIQGNWKRAKAENERISKAAEKSLEMRGKLKIDVLSVLSEEQHEILVDRYPRLVYKPWTRAMGGRRAR